MFRTYDSGQNGQQNTGFFRNSKYNRTIHRCHLLRQNSTKLLNFTCSFLVVDKKNRVKAKKKKLYRIKTGKD